MSPVLRYHTGGGVYADLPGSVEEVTISASQPPVLTDLWVDTQDNTGGLPMTARNVIRNGDMSVAQRGEGPFTSTNRGIDGYLPNSNTSFSVTRTAPVPGTGIGYALQAVVSGQTGAASDYSQIRVFIEDATTLEGKQFTFSFMAKALSGTPKIGLAVMHAFGSGGSPDTTPVYFSPVTISTSWARYSISGVMPSIAGKTIGTAGVTGSALRLNIWLSGGTDYSGSSGVGIQNNTFSLTDVQLEEGNVATPFERLPIQQQLAWCQRYFYRLTPKVDGPSVGAGLVFSGSQAVIFIPLPVSMRAGPSVTVGNIGKWAILRGDAAWIWVTAMQGAQFSDTGGRIVLGTAGGLTGGSGTTLEGSGAAPTPYIDFSAEL